MDLIGSVQYIENRLAGRKFSQRKGESAQKYIRTAAEEESKSCADERHAVPDYDAHIGRIIDTSA